MRVSSAGSIPHRPAGGGATLVAGSIVASRYAAVRQHRGAVFRSSTSVRELLRSRVTAWLIAVIVAEFALAGLLHGLARLTG